MKCGNMERRNWRAGFGVLSVGFGEGKGDRRDGKKRWLFPL